MRILTTIEELSRRRSIIKYFFIYKSVIKNDIGFFNGFKPFNVINSGCQVQLQLNILSPYEPLPLSFSYENRDHHELWLSHRHELQSPQSVLRQDALYYNAITMDVDFLIFHFRRYSLYIFYLDVRL